MLPRLIGNMVEGNTRGKCMMCGMETQKGHRDKLFSEKFTSGNALMSGNCLCEYCYAFFKDQNYRRNSFVAVQGGVRFLSREECRNVLLDPPEPPFFVYITRSKQKQGWLSALHCVSYSRDYYIVATDFVEHFLAKREEMINISKTIDEATSLKISKKSLLTGHISTEEYEYLIKKKREDIVDKIKPYVKCPAWEVMIYVS